MLLGDFEHPIFSQQTSLGSRPKNSWSTRRCLNTSKYIFECCRYILFLFTVMDSDVFLWIVMECVMRMYESVWGVVEIPFPLGHTCISIFFILYVLYICIIYIYIYSHPGRRVLQVIHVSPGPQGFCIPWMRNHWGTMASVESSDLQRK